MKMRLSLAYSLSLALAAAVAADAARTVTLYIPSISCPVCAGKVREALSGKPGVGAVAMDPTARTAQVTLSNPTAPSDSFVEWIHAAGYVSSVIGETGVYRLEGTSGRPERDRALAALRQVPGVREAREIRGRSGARVVVIYEKGRVLDADLTAAVRAAVAPRLRMVRDRS